MCISRNDAQAYIAWLSQETGAGYRLLTEAEWEYACRAGKQTRFYWGDDPNNEEIDDYAWYDGNSESKTHDAGQKKPNAWGLFDMSGNVWEWCQDWYGNYSSGAQKDPKGPKSGSSRVLRGGSWDDNAVYLRSAFRSRYAPAFSYYDIGFRVVRTP